MPGFHFRDDLGIFLWYNNARYIMIWNHKRCLLMDVPIYVFKLELSNFCLKSSERKLKQQKLPSSLSSSVFSSGILLYSKVMQTAREYVVGTENA